MRGETFAFGPFTLDPAARRLARNDETVALSARLFDLLHFLVAHAGTIQSKDALIQAAWPDVAVGDNSLEQAISALRRLLSHPSEVAFIETEPRRGYRFSAEVARLQPRESDATLDSLLAPHRAWLDGRAALETLERDQIVRARTVFEGLLANAGAQAQAHVGLANACAMQFEMTRSEATPDLESLQVGLHHAREACRIDSQYGEAWATLGFVLQRTGRSDDALAASRRAVALEPDNWRHHLRLAYASWGEERLRESRRTLALLPEFPMAHWLAATVLVARQAFDEAGRELSIGLAGQRSAPAARFGAVALEWLSGLLHLSLGDEDEARARFEREIAHESSRQLYAQECSANAWYALGALALHRQRRDEAVRAFGEARRRHPRHPGASAALNWMGQPAPADDRRTQAAVMATPFDLASATAVRLTLSGDTDGAAAAVDAALAAAPAGSAGWLLPLDPLLRLWEHPRPWSAALSRLRNRAA